MRREEMMLRALVVSLMLLPGLVLEASEEQTSFQFWVNYGISDYPIDGLVLLDDQARQLDQLILWDLFKNTSIPAYTISPSGRLFAIAGSTYFPGDVGDNLYVYNTASDTMLMTAPTTTNQYMTLAFAGEEQVAASTLLERGKWSITVYEVATGQVIHSLTDEQLSGYFPSYATHPWLPPVIRAFDGQRLHFATTHQNRDKQGFVWSLEDGTIKADNAYLNDGAQSLAATGEVVMPLMDDRLLFYNIPDHPMRPPYLGYAGNSVQVYDPALQAYFPIYNETNGVVVGAYWVQNGERLLVGVQNGPSSTPRWLLLERDGSLVGTLFTGSFYSYESTGIFNTPDGFLIRTGYFQLNDPQHDEAVADPNTYNTIYAYNTRTLTYRSYADQLRYEFENKPPQSPPIIWSSPAAPTAPLPPFAALMPPIPVSEPVAQGLTLRVNGAAYVTTFNGETLNVRATPSREAEILARAQNNQRFLLLEGPVLSEGLSWWRVLWRERQIMGWVVEGLGDERTLRPPDISRSEPLTLIEANLILGDTGFAPLEAGMYVRVISDNLLIRATTSMNALVDHVLLRGSRLTLVEGYTEADGLRWWRVETDTGLTGWAADSNPDGELTLAPVG